MDACNTHISLKVRLHSPQLNKMFYSSKHPCILQLNYRLHNFGAFRLSHSTRCLPQGQSDSTAFCFFPVSLRIMSNAELVLCVTFSTLSIYIFAIYQIMCIVLCLSPGCCCFLCDQNIFNIFVFSYTLFASSSYWNPF